MGKAVALGVQEGKDLSELTLEQLQQFSDLIQADVFEKALTLEASVNARNHIGGTAPAQVEAAIERAHARLEETLRLIAFALNWSIDMSRQVFAVSINKKWKV